MTDWHSVTDCVYNLLEQWKTEIGKVANDSLNEMNENEQKNSHPLQALKQPRQTLFLPKILTPYVFYSNLHLHFLRWCCKNISKVVCIVSEKSGK